MIAWFADAQARLTVYAWQPFGSIGISETSRAMFGASTDGTTVPKTSASTSSPSRLGALNQLGDAPLAELDRGRALEHRARRANGVRTPATIATRRPGRTECWACGERLTASTAY